MLALTAPEGGTPPLIEDARALSAALDELSRGEGPIAIDAERASGFRYSSRAYLIQIFRRGGGLHLIDPIALAGDSQIKELNDLIAPEEIIIHASTQDLPCLREFGIFPQRLFDTELGARIAGLERVGLGPLCESLLEISLAKEHSAVDWSTRPLLQEWLDYAALDVAVLIDLRGKVAALLEETGKIEYALQDFASILTAPESKPKSDPWRRTSGMHLIKGRFELAIIRNLYEERDVIAREIDMAPGRLFSDAIIVDVARFKPKSKADFRNLASVKSRIRNERLRDRIDQWWEIIEKSYLIPEPEWPEMRGRGDGPPPPKVWRDRFPLAYAHLTHARSALQDLSDSISIPVENLMTPDLVRRAIFDEGRERHFTLSDELASQIKEKLLESGARQWQVELCASLIAQSLTQDQPLVKESPVKEISEEGPEPGSD